MPPDPPEYTYFDHQVNGFAGVDFQSSDLTQAQLKHAVSELLRHRTTQILLTLITDRIDSLEQKLARIEAYREQDRVIANTIVGYHLEGPYLSPKSGFHGAHPAEFMKAPCLHEFRRLQKAANGRIRLITIAPEWEGSLPFIQEVAELGVRVGIGHSDADDATIERSIKAGLSLCTHLGNALPLHTHRHDNIMQRLLCRDELMAAFIPDGLHLPQNVLQNLVRAKQAEKVIFTTDCMSAAGIGPGAYTLGRLKIECGEDGVVREPGKMNFAGSSLTMDQAHANVLEWLRWDDDQAAQACGARAAQFFGF